jgi:hypothetical protein
VQCWQKVLKRSTRLRPNLWLENALTVSVLNSRRRILRKFRNATWEALAGDVLETLGMDPGEKRRRHHSD